MAVQQDAPLILVKNDDAGSGPVDPVPLDGGGDQDREQPRGPARLEPETKQIIRGVQVRARSVKEIMHVAVPGVDLTIDRSRENRHRTFFGTRRPGSLAETAAVPRLRAGSLPRLPPIPGIMGRFP
jgi:hypothetical protein